MTFVKGEIPEGAKPFKPGESGNPDGRPKGSKSFATILNALLDLAATEEDYSDDRIKKIFPDKKATNREIMMARMLIDAKRDGDSRAAQRIMERLEGKVVQPIKQEIELPGKQINISIGGNDIDLSK